MDINGTYFHYINHERDWEAVVAASGSGICWDRTRQAVSLSPKALLYEAKGKQGQVALTEDHRRGAAFDGYGNLYVINQAKTAIQVLPHGKGELETYWRLQDLHQACEKKQQDGDFRTATADGGDIVDTQLQGLAVNNQHFLIVGTIDPAGLLILDLHAGGVPLWLQWPASIQFEPFDFCALEDGGVCILDRGVTGGRLWKLNRELRITPMNTDKRIIVGGRGDFAASRTSTEVYDCERYQHIVETDATPITTVDPIAVHALEKGRFLVLDKGMPGAASSLRLFDQTGPVAQCDLDSHVFGDLLAKPFITAYDFAYLALSSENPYENNGLLYVADNAGQQVYRFYMTADTDSLSLQLEPAFFPMLGFAGKALVAFNDKVYYDGDTRWLTVTEQPRQRYVDSAEISGLLFDGKEPGCVWHRLFVDACLPKTTSIEIYSRSHDDLQALMNSEWQREESPYLRQQGSEIFLHEPFSERETQFDGIGTWELLFQKAQGQYIELKIRVTGNGRVTPRFRALRIYYPRFSYLDRYLPSVYSEDSHSASFLDRYLANVEGMFTDIEARIERAEVVFDSRITPPAYLDWLAQWLGVVLDSDWDEARQRLFIANAQLLFQWRGTQLGLRAFLKLAIDPCPDQSIFSDLTETSAVQTGGLGGSSIRIVEQFLYRRSTGASLGDPTAATSLVQIKGIADLEQDKATHKRYQAFLRQRYGKDLTTEFATLQALNKAWETAYTSFAQIEFNATRPEHPVQGIDWIAFVQNESARQRTWQPQQGVYALQLRYQNYVRRQYPDLNDTELLTRLNAEWGGQYQSMQEVAFPPVTPNNDQHAMVWRRFLQAEMGFTYADVTEDELERYKTFLAHRHRDIARLNKNYGYSETNTLPGFDDIDFPESMPAQGAELQDWIEFVSLALPIQRNSHRFTVLVPTVPGESPQTREQRLAQVEKIVEREKPSHTDFDVKFYWALFQVGTARLGEDTVLGEGSRFTAIVLNENYLGQGYLDYWFPWNLRDRNVVGRNALTAKPHGERRYE